MSITKSIISRFAPSPTQTSSDPMPHLGFYRTLYHSWLAARSTVGGKFILRIDDTDLARSTDENIDLILNAIDDIGLDYDEMFKQSDRFERYNDVASWLISRNLAKKEDGCIKLSSKDVADYDRQSGNGTLGSWVEEVAKKKGGPKVMESNKAIKDFAFNQVIIKSDGSPVYNFCTVVDDYDMGITNIIRGTDHISNTYKQAVIYDICEWTKPKFHHVGLVCNSSGAKLSKRESNEMNLSSYNKDALLNYVLRLGWAPYIDDKNSQIIDKNRAMKMFWNEGRLKPANAKCDINKLQFLSKKHSNA